jgi:hypothetical protein
MGLAAKSRIQEERGPFCDRSRPGGPAAIRFTHSRTGISFYFGSGRDVRKKLLCVA